MDELTGRVAVVTGAASGIGRAVAERLGSEGMSVVLADIEQGPLEAAAGELTAAGLDVHPVVTDVSSADSVERLAAETVGRYGAVHVLHNNAGVVAAGPVAEIPIATWEWVLGVDLWSVIHGIRAFLPLIEAAGEGHIVSTASSAGLQAAAGIAPYNVAKFGVVALSETLALELAQAGSPIGVSVLCPGAVNTRIVDADRNRPASVAAVHPTTAVEQRFKASAGSLLAERGLAPAEVAERVLEAIRTRRFWILPHPGWADVMAERAAAMGADGHLHSGFGG